MAALGENCPKDLVLWRTEATRGAQTDPRSSLGLKAGRKHWGRQQRGKKKSTVVEIAVEAWKINLNTGEKLLWMVQAAVIQR